MGDVEMSSSCVVFFGSCTRGYGRDNVFSWCQCSVGFVPQTLLGSGPHYWPAVELLAKARVKGSLLCV